MTEAESLAGGAGAIRPLCNVRIGVTQTMDFHVEFDQDEVRADLVSRELYEFWKMRPST